MGPGAFGGEAFLLASATFVAEVLVVGFFFPLFFLAAMFSLAASSSLLVPPTIAANDGVGPLGGWGGAPVAGGAWGGWIAEGRGREDWAWGGAVA